MQTLRVNGDKKQQKTPAALELGQILLELNAELSVSGASLPLVTQVRH